MDINDCLESSRWKQTAEGIAIVWDDLTLLIDFNTHLQKTAVFLNIRKGFDTVGKIPLVINDPFPSCMFKNSSVPRQKFIPGFGQNYITHASFNRGWSFPRGRFLIRYCTLTMCFSVVLDVRDSLLSASLEHGTNIKSCSNYKHRLQSS